MPRVIVSHSTSRPAPPPLGHLPLASPARTPPPDALAELRAGITHSLQLSRASTMALMRLQLALRSGDRTQALEAVDRLGMLDAQLEEIVARLAPHDDGADETLEALGKHLETQKLALAFEKLALASGIVGPDLVSIESAWPARQPVPPAEPGQWEPSGELPDMPELAALRPPQEEFEPRHPRGLSPAAWGIVLTLLLAAAIGGAFLLLH